MSLVRAGVRTKIAGRADEASETRGREQPRSRKKTDLSATWEPPEPVLEFDAASTADQHVAVDHVKYEEHGIKGEPWNIGDPGAAEIRRPEARAKQEKAVKRR